MPVSSGWVVHGPKQLVDVEVYVGASAIRYVAQFAYNILNVSARCGTCLSSKVAGWYLNPLV